MLKRNGWTPAHGRTLLASAALVAGLCIMGAAMDGARLITPRGTVEGSEQPVPPGTRIAAPDSHWDAESGTFAATGALVPRVRIIQWDDSVARFDAATGSIHRFNGDLEKPNVRSQWLPLVRGVTQRTSGVLQIQRPDGVHAINAPFLVDVITGETWILRRRGANAAWDKVEVFR